MPHSPRTLPALALAGGLLVAAVLLQIPSARAQDPPVKSPPEKTDPVEAFQSDAPSANLRTDIWPLLLGT